MSLKVLTITAKFVYPRELNYDDWICEYVDDVEVSDINQPVKANPNEVNKPDLEDEEKDIQAKYPKDKVTVPSDEENGEGDPGAILRAVCGGIGGKCQKEDLDAGDKKNKINKPNSATTKPLQTDFRSPWQYRFW